MFAGFLKNHRMPTLLITTTVVFLAVLHPKPVLAYPGYMVRYDDSLEEIDNSYALAESKEDLGDFEAPSTLDLEDDGLSGPGRFIRHSSRPVPRPPESPPSKVMNNKENFKIKMKGNNEKRYNANYLTLCHFKICNMGRKRTARYLQVLRTLDNDS